jgi:hypothetical protein
MHASREVSPVSYRAMDERGARIGPRGGKTTLTPGGLLKKTVYFDQEEWEALRKKSYDEQRPISDLIRSLIREGLGIDKE